MTEYIQRVELLDLNNPKERQFAIDFVGKSLKVDWPRTYDTIVVSDKTPEGKKELNELLAKGYRVISKKDD